MEWKGMKWKRDEEVGSFNGNVAYDDGNYRDIQDQVSCVLVVLEYAPVYRGLHGR